MPAHPPANLTLSEMTTPLGRAFLVTDASGVLRAFDWSDDEGRLGALMRRFYGPRVAMKTGAAPRAIPEAIAAYFDGALEAINAIPRETAGAPFQKLAWRVLCEIPAGQTLTYGQQARRMGKPAAVRAVGQANGANPIGLVVPCHRVIGANGTLTGYGAGVERKAWLLRHEGVELETPRRL